MPLKAVVTSLDDLPEAAKELYRPGEEVHKGKFILDVEPVEGFALEHIEGLRGAFGTTKQKLEASEKALESYKGLPAASALKDKLKRLEKLESFDPEIEADKLAKARSAQAIEDATARHTVALAEAAAESDRLWGALNGALVANVAKDAITKESGSPALLMPHVKARTKVDRATLAVTVLREDGTNFYNNKGEPGTIDDLIADLKKHPDYGRAFEATASGSGANPVRQSGGGVLNGKNPFAKGTFNLTEQMQLIKSDPNRAAHLKALAAQG